MSSKPAQSSLTPGRILIYANPINGLPELAVVLGETPPSCITPQTAITSTSASTSAAGAGTSPNGGELWSQWFRNLNGHNGYVM